MKISPPSFLVLCTFASALLFSSAAGTVLISDAFTYSNGPLAGNGGWERGPNTPTSDNPSNHIVVTNNTVVFDWTTSAAINNVVRNLWTADNAVTTGSVYAIFDFRVTQAPLSATDVRPGFFSFGNADGSQQRGFVGIQAGSVADTFRLGISQASQLGSSFSFSGTNLSLNTTYQVMVGFDAGTQATSLWINSLNPSDPAAVTIAAAGTNGGIRRANLRMYNSDGGTGTTNLGIFELDNLTVTTIPEPGVYAAILGLGSLALIANRRRKAALKR
jgi:hypothetical protein